MAISTFGDSSTYKRSSYFFSLRATSRPVAFGDINPGFHTWLPQRFTSASSVNTNQGIKHGAGLLGYNDIMDIIYIYIYVDVGKTLIYINILDIYMYIYILYPK